MSTAINEEVLELAGTETPNMWVRKNHQNGRREKEHMSLHSSVYPLKRALGLVYDTEVLY